MGRQQTPRPGPSRMVTFMDGAVRANSGTAADPIARSPRPAPRPPPVPHPTACSIGSPDADPAVCTRLWQASPAHRPMPNARQFARQCYHHRRKCLYLLDLRSRPTDLQSAPLVRSGTRPASAQLFTRWKRTSNPHDTIYVPRTRVATVVHDAVNSFASSCS